MRRFHDTLSQYDERMPLDLQQVRHRVGEALHRVGADWTDWQSTALRTDFTPDERLAMLLLVIATPDGTHEYVTTGGPLLAALRRRKLPWDATTAAFAVEAAMGNRYHHARVGTVLRGVELSLGSGGSDVQLYERLLACAAWLDELTTELYPYGAWGLELDRRTAHRLLAQFLPAGVLDLSVVQDGDNWAEPARLAARSSDPVAVEGLVRLLGELGHRAPTRAWGSAMTAVLAEQDPRQLLGTWLQLAAHTEETSELVPNAPYTRLFAPGNDDLVRAAVFAVRYLPEHEPFPVEELGMLVRRGAATRPGHRDPVAEELASKPSSTESFALRVATASIDTLGAASRPECVLELERLMEDVTRRDLVRRIGALLGEAGVQRAQERERELRRVKAAAVRRKADPRPREVRAEVDKLLRRHLGPTLRGLGFRVSGRTWRRSSESQVEVISITSSGTSIRAECGVLLHACQPEGYPGYRRDPARAQAFQTHLVLRDRAVEAEPVTLDRLADWLSAVAVPFLEGLAERSRVTESLLGGIGIPVSHDGEPLALENGEQVTTILGALALAEGDFVGAEGWFEEYRALIAERFSDEYAVYAHAVGDFWEDRLREMRQNPAG